MDGKLHQFTIYDHPLDAPNHFVVREWLIDADGPAPASAYRCGSLDEARDYIQRINPDLVCLHRSPADDPVIVETWT